MRLTPEEKRKIYTIMVVVCLSLGLYFLFLRMDKIWANLAFIIRICKPILLGLSLAFILNILLIQIEKFLVLRLKIKKPGLVRFISIVLTYVVFIALIVFFAIYILPTFAESLLTLINKLPDLMEKMLDKLDNIKFLEDKMPAIKEFIEGINTAKIRNMVLKFILGEGQNNFTGAINLLAGIVQSSFEAFMVLIFSIYALSSKENLQSNSRKLLYSVFREKTADNIYRACKLLYINFYHFFTGQFLEALILGILCFIGMTILAIPYSLMISVFIGFANLIPYFGATIGSLVSAALIFIIEPFKGLIFLIFIIVLQQIDGNYLYPKLVGGKMGIPSIWILMSITVGGALMGIVGMIIFVPFLATVYMMLKAYANNVLDKKGIDVEAKKNINMHMFSDYDDAEEIIEYKEELEAEYKKEKENKKNNKAKKNNSSDK